ncbi:hypothetical protein Tco_0931777 [Tanacetum coccineum]
MEDRRDKVQAEYHMLEMQPQGLLSELGFDGGSLWEKGGKPDWEAEESFLHNVSEDKETAKTATGVANGIMMLKMVPKTPLQFGVAERLSRTFMADSTGLHAEAPKIGGMTREGYKSHTLEENSRSFVDSGRSYEEYSEDGVSSKEEGSKTLQKATNEEMVSLEKNQTCSLIKLPAGKKASQRLWMFKVKEEQNSSEKEPSFVGALNNTSIEHKRRGFSASWVKRKPKVQTKGNSIWIKASTKTMVRCSKKQVLGYVLIVGITTVEWESGLQKSITMLTIEV